MTKAVEGGGFSWTIRVYQEDVDAGGIFYYANYLRYMERARSEWLRQLTLDQSTLGSQQIIFVVRRCNVEYKRPAYLDDELQVLVEVSESSRVQLDIHHRVLRRAKQGQNRVGDDGGHEEIAEEIANGSVTIACLCRASMRPMRMPEHLCVWQ